MNAIEHNRLDEVKNLIDIGADVKHRFRENAGVSSQWKHVQLMESYSTLLCRWLLGLLSCNKSIKLLSAYYFWAATYFCYVRIWKSA